MTGGPCASDKLTGSRGGRACRRPRLAPGLSGIISAGIWEAGRVPWVPELFTAPVLQRLVDSRRRDELVAVPYFEGLLAEEPDALVESFAGEPELHDAVR